MEIGKGEDVVVNNKINTFHGPVVDAIRNRRVSRNFTHEDIPNEYILTLLESGRFAPTGGGRRVIEYIVIKNEENIRKIRAVSPGILNLPKTILLMIINHNKEKKIEFDDTEQFSSYVDIGTAMENILLTAYEINLGACPIMSFHKGAIRVLLDLPNHVEPVLMIILGFQLDQKKNKTGKKLQLSKLKEITSWEKYGQFEQENI